MIIILKKVLYVPGFLTNLVFLSSLQKKKIYWQLDNFIFQMTKTDVEIRVCKIVKSLFVL